MWPARTQCQTAHSCAPASCTCCSCQPCRLQACPLLQSFLLLPLGFTRRFLLAGNCAFARALAGAGVGVGALAVHRQSPPVTRAAIALNVDQALDVHLHVLAQVAFNVPFVLDHLADAVDLFLAQVLDLLEGIHIRLLQNLERAGIPDAKDVCERDACLLCAGQIDASNTCHSDSFATSVVCPRSQPVRTG